MRLFQNIVVFKRTIQAVVAAPVVIVLVVKGDPYVVIHLYSKQCRPSIRSHK
jgi:hypothetical protein